MRTILTTAALLLALIPTAYAAEATFLGKSTYTASAGDCEKLQALARGAAKPSLTTVPDTLTAKGYRSWEGGCTIANVKANRVRQAVGIKSWTVNLVCGEGAVENQQSRETWRQNRDGSITVTGASKSQRFSVCAIPGKAAKR
jgi:hypothetical protein